MKIRTGFVSNSSSSSFVLIGERTSEITEERAVELGLDYTWDDDEGKYLVGRFLAKNECELDGGSISLEEINKIFKELTDMGIKPSLIYGELRQ